MPDDNVSTENLKKAGFMVAEYTGGGGGYDDMTYRLCGIDGGGYSFSGAHFSRALAYHHEEKGYPVQTDQGTALITTDDRPPLVVLAEG